MSLERPAIGILGLGLIGSRCAANLDRAGYPVQAWNRSPREAAVPIVAHPAQLAQSAQILSIYLKDSAAVLETFGQLEAELSPQHIVLNHATIDLHATEELAARCAEIGCGFLDCPFTGSRDAAASGNLVYYASGDADLLERVRQLLEVNAKEIQFTGPIGTATTLKLATNLVAASFVQALAEGLALTRAQGLDGELFARAMASNASHSALAALKLPQMVRGEFDPHFTLENMRKDCVQMQSLARQHGLQLPGLETVLHQLETRASAGDGPLDYAALARSFGPFSA